MPSSLLTKGNAWLTRLVAYPGDNEETLVIKKIWLSTGVAITLISFVSSFQWLFWMGLRTLFIMELVYIGFYMVLIALFLWLRRGIDRFILATALFHIFFSFSGVCLHGGIIASAGLVFVGWGGGPVYLLLLQKNRKWAVPIQVLFMVTVVAEILLQPILKPDPNLSPDEATILFSGFFLIITLAVFLMLRYSIGQNDKIKKAEKARIQELAEMKTRFYTNLTHEFRTPLTVILGMADQMEEKPADYFRVGLGLIRQNGNRLLRLVNQMMDLSKLEAGAMPVHYIQGDVIPYLLNILEPYQRLAEGKNSSIHLENWPDTLKLDFDPEKLESLLGNLLSNAVKHTPKGGEIEVQVGTAEGEWEEDASWFSLLGQEIPGKRWLFAVKDHGSGIAREEINHIFDRFYQVDSGRKEGETNFTQGTGIGLAVVKELLRLLGGHLFIQSVVGAGTEFRVYLPYTNTAKPAPAAMSVPLQVSLDLENDEDFHTSAIIRKEHPQILIVEDNSGVVQYLRSILADDYQIGVAVNGQEGIDKALETIPDLIISDVMMPRKDGFNLCKTLKNDFRTSHIPIILLSAKADMESSLTGLEHGADAYMSKPFNSRELLTRVRKLIELRHVLREKYRAMSEPDALPVSDTPGPDEAFFNQLRSAIEAHSGEEEFHVAQLCQILGISRVQLFRKLKALTGSSASEFIRAYRLNKAKAMLADTDLNISEIAFEVGFKDPAYFTRAFTREFGMAPSAWRK